MFALYSQWSATIGLLALISPCFAPWATGFFRSECCTGGRPTGISTGPGFEPKTRKTVLPACPVSCSTLTDRWKEMVHAPCCHWLAFNSIQYLKVAAWPMAQAGIDGCRRLLVTLSKRVFKAMTNATETLTGNYRVILVRDAGIAVGQGVGGSKGVEGNVNS